jgi:uncharacterized protein with von Willebrand factor type A (vWA) domain
VDDLLEGLGQTLLVVHVPAERGEEGVEELKAELFLFVVSRQEDLAVLVEAFDQTFDGIGDGRSHRCENISTLPAVKPERARAMPEAGGKRAMTDSMTEYLKESMTEYLKESLSESLSESLTEYLSEFLSDSLSESL